MKQTTVFMADDGTQFSDADECERYEELLFVRTLCNLEEKDVKAALSRTNVKLADVIERAGAIIADKRREMGELRRKTKAPK